MRKVSVLFGIIFVFFIFIFFWWQNGNQPVNKNDASQQIFIVQKGSGIREIANKLKQENLIRDTVVFFLIVKKEGLDNKIQAGDFRLSPSMPAFAIAENLTHGTLDVWITVPEGKRAEEITDILKEKLQTYDPSWRTTLIKNEGYLFPDTYLIPKNADIDLIVGIMKGNFDKQFAQIQRQNTKLTKDEIVTIASLVEREAKHDVDRPLVASVITNRFEIGMKLDIDATIQYALGYQPKEKTWWKKGLTRDDIDLTSPYNTYRVAGLPPTPIANPGLAALKAAANPAKTDYMYYITDKQGINRYGKTIQEHNMNISKYGL